MSTVDRLAKPLDHDRRRALVVTVIRDRPVYGRTPTLRHLVVRAHLQLVRAREEAIAARVAVEEVVRVASLLGDRRYRGASGGDIKGLAERVAADLRGYYPEDDERHLLVAAASSLELVELLGGGF